jgi:hypothetical protein
LPLSVARAVSGSPVPGGASPNLQRPQAVTAVKRRVAAGPRDGGIRRPATGHHRTEGLIEDEGKGDPVAEAVAGSGGQGFDASADTGDRRAEEMGPLDPGRHAAEARFDAIAVLDQDGDVPGGAEKADSRGPPCRLRP